MEKINRYLAVRKEEYGTLDIWVNPEGEGSTIGNKKMNIVVTFNGEPISKGMAYSCSFQDCENAEEMLDWLMGYIDRDTQNWYWKDLVIHWGVHTLRFVNERNIDKVEKNEDCRNLEDIKFYYDVEW